MHTSVYTNFKPERACLSLHFKLASYYGLHAWSIPTKLNYTVYI